MAKRLRFSIAQPITVGGWYIASVLLICLTAIYPRSTDTRNRELTQAYYYAIMAAALYFFVSSLMLVTIYGARTHHYSRDFHLTNNQRSLMLQSIIYMLYLLLGALVYAHVEGWKYLDALYWADITLLTDGLGDIAPVTHLGRSLLLPYAAGGILTLSLLISSIRSLMLERGKKKIIARTTEKLRDAVARRLGSGIPGRWYGFPKLPRNPNASEDQQKREEFYLMRRIHSMAAIYTRWYTLVFALMAWICLWLLGALAFYLSEREAQWTYFQSIYFAYTSLLTIGYGDFAPGAQWSRPFFVLWSLLAIPTTTIVFSAFGDTLTKLFHDSVIYVGELTILPGEIGFKTHLRVLLERLGHCFRNPLHQALSPPSDRELKINEAVSARYSKELAELKRHSSDTIQNRRRRRYLMSREIRKLSSDLGEAPPKHYTYEEWCFYLYLVNRLDSCCSFTNMPSEEPTQNGTLGVGLRAFKPQFHVKHWSWIGRHTPLMGNKDEAEWLFDSLLSALDLELKAEFEDSENHVPEESTNSSETPP